MAKKQDLCSAQFVLQSKLATKILGCDEWLPGDCFIAFKVFWAVILGCTGWLEVYYQIPWNNSNHFEVNLGDCIFVWLEKK